MVKSKRQAKTERSTGKRKRLAVWELHGERSVWPRPPKVQLLYHDAFVFIQPGSRVDGRVVSELEVHLLGPGSWYWTLKPERVRVPPADVLGRVDELDRQIQELQSERERVLDEGFFDWPIVTPAECGYVVTARRGRPRKTS